MIEDNLTCPLCHSSAKLLLHDKIRSYLACESCELIFVPERYHLSFDDERKRYEHHQNNPEDHEYRKFLSKLTNPLTKYLRDGMTGIDYGSGPGPAISAMLGELGFEVFDYDPIFEDHSELLKKQYDFVTCTEVVEHFRNPFDEWNKLVELVKPDGLLGIMTTLYDDSINFDDWHYRRDDTHLSFYSIETIEWIEKKFNLTREYYDSTVIILKKLQHHIKKGSTPLKYRGRTC